LCSTCSLGKETADECGPTRMRPILVQLGPVPLRAYGVMMMVGFLVGLYRALRAARRRGIEPSHVADAALYSLLAGIVGARVVFVLLNWADFSRDLKSVFSVWEGGLSFHGGVLFGAAVVCAYVRAKRIPFLAMADLLAPSLALGYAFARIGCFLNGCCYGVPCNLPLCVKFPELPGPVHPTQLYAAGAGLLIFLILTRVEKAQRPSGFVFASYLLLYSMYRFLIEILRKGASAQVWFWGLTEAQVVSLLVFGVAAIWVACLRTRRES